MYDYLLPPFLVWLSLTGLALIITSWRHGRGGSECSRCGYDLRAHTNAPGRCPECGGEFDFDDAGNVAMRRRPRMWRVIVGVILLILAIAGIMHFYVIPIVIPSTGPPTGGMPI